VLDFEKKLQMFRQMLILGTKSQIKPQVVF